MIFRQNNSKDFPSASVILAGIGIAFPVLLPLQITAIVCGSLGGLVKLIRRKLTTKSKKHHEIKTMAECKLNSIKDLISKSLTDGQISENEFKLILDELEKYNKLNTEHYFTTWPNMFVTKTYVLI